MKPIHLSYAVLAAMITAVPGSSGAATTPDEDGRIARLEAAVAALQSRVESQAALKSENAALRDQVAQLRGAVGALTTRTTAPPASVPASTASGGNAPVVASTFANGEPGIATADGRFSLNLYALVQLDAAAYSQGAVGPITTDLRRSGPALGYSASNLDTSHARQLKSGDDFRRARFGFSGDAFGEFEYRTVFDFGGSGVENAGQLYEGWAQYSGFSPLQIRVGAFAPQQGLADQDSNAAQPFLERPISADIARSFAAGDTRTAVQLFASSDRGLASIAATGRTVGVISSAANATAQTYGDPLAVVGRLVVSPLAGPDWRVHLGVHGQYLAQPADTSGPTNTNISPASRYSVTLNDQAELRVDGTKLLNTGAIDARHAENEGAEVAAQWRGLLLQGEYDHFDVQRVLPVRSPHFAGFYVEGSWVLTGESRLYNTATAAFDAPPVRHPVGSGGYGVVELAGRYSEMNLNFDAGGAGSAPAPDAIRGGETRIWTAGLNWYLNPYVRVAFEGQHVTIDRLSPDAATYLTPIGARIGQSYDAVALRSQLGF